jgi:hypothetical protein
MDFKFKRQILTMMNLGLFRHYCPDCHKFVSSWTLFRGGDFCGRHTFSRANELYILEHDAAVEKMDKAQIALDEIKRLYSVADQIMAMAWVDDANRGKERSLEESIFPLIRHECKRLRELEEELRKCKNEVFRIRTQNYL